MGDALVWWLTLQVMGIVAFPIGAVALRSLPDRGYSASKALGLLLAGWLAYMLAMLKLVPYGRLLLVGCVLAIAGFSLWLLLRNERALLDDLRARLRTRAFIQYIVVCEALFLVAFVVWTIVRAYNPDIIHQEKFMDYGFLNAIVKSESFPPNDMWLAGNSINYYYFGYVLIASVTVLSGVATQVAFNLANSSLFALTALGAFGVAYNLIAGRLLTRPAKATRASAPASADVPKRKVKKVAEPAKQAQVSAVPTRRSRTAREATVEVSDVGESAITVAVHEAEPLSTRSRKGGNGHSESEALPLSQATQVPAGPAYEPMTASLDSMPRVRFFLSPYLFATLAALMVVAMGNLTTIFARHDGPPLEGNGWRYCFLCNTGQPFDWWAPSRIIQDYTTVARPGEPLSKTPVGFETINEFPVFSFLLADMHPHVLALPLVLLAIACAHAFARRRVRGGLGWRSGVPPGLQGWLALGVGGLVIGSLYTTNTWDFPTYLLVLLVASIVPYLAGQRRSERSRGWIWLRGWVVQSAMVAAGSILLFLPFHMTFKSLVGGAPAEIPQNLANIPVLGWVLEKLGTLVLVNTADKTILGFLVIFGVFLVGLLVWLIYELVAYLRRRWDAGYDINFTMAAWGGTLLITFLAAFLFKFPLLALLLPVASVALYLLWQEPRRTERNVALALVAVAALIGLVIEVVFLKDNFGMRMNTLFKFYYQIWVMWAVAAAYAVWRTLYSAFSEKEVREERGRATYLMPTTHPGVRAGTAAWAGVFALLVISGCMYSVWGAQSRQIGNQTQVRGLDGTGWLQTGYQEDYQAINWLKENGKGNQIVLESGSNEYDLPGRVSAFSGVPTLVGWDNSHEDLWRTNQPELKQARQQRRTDVNAIYSGIDPANGGPLTAQRLLELLNGYGVDYVFVGAAERGTRFDSTKKFPNEVMTEYAEGLFKQALAEEYRVGTTVVYSVKQEIAGTGIAPPTPAANGNTTPVATSIVADPNVPPISMFTLGAAGINRGQFNAPRGIARDAAGNFYVVDTGNLRVQKFDAAGKWLLAFGGDKGNGDGQFGVLRDDAIGTGPGGIAVDEQGNIYVADTWNHRIQKFDSAGNFLTSWGSFLDLSDANTEGAADKDRKFYGPRGVAIGPGGDVYVTDTGNKRVLIFDANGAFKRKIDSGMAPGKAAPDYPFNLPGEMNEPIGIAVDTQGNVYVADTNNGRLQKFDATGAPAAQWPIGAGWEPGEYLEPFLEVDGAGNIYASAPTGRKVVKYSPTGDQLGQKTGEANVTIVLPTGLVADAEGNVYVVDTRGNGVVKLEAGGW